ncbi:MFS transporter, partial [Yinghuangia soli]
MQTYRVLFRTPEFTPFFANSCALVAAHTISALALGTLVYDATGSPLLAALSMFGPSLTQVVGATVLLSAADRLPPRGALAGIAVCLAVGVAALAVPGLPIAALFAILLAMGLIGSVSGGVRYGLLDEILPSDGYVLGRSVLNMSSGTVQILGFALGAVLVGALSARGALLAAAGLDLAAAAIAYFGLTRRPARSEGRPSISATWRVNRELWSAPQRRSVYLALSVPNGLIVGCESLFVAYAPNHAGLMFAAAAFGMLIGDTLTGRFLSTAWRARLAAPMRLLLAVPYLLFAFDLPVPLAAAVALVASTGFAAGLMLQERLLAITPARIRGQALGLHSAGMLTMQGVGAAIAGAVAQFTSPGGGRRAPGRAPPPPPPPHPTTPPPPPPPPPPP